MEGRIVDLYTRVTAPKENFFMPHDNEISARELNQIMEKVKRENNSLKGAPGMKHVALTHHKILKDNSIDDSSYIALYEKSKISYY